MNQQLPQAVAEPAFTSASELLALLGQELAGRPHVRLEFSLRLQPGEVAQFGRFGVWLNVEAAADATPLARLLAQLRAPADVLAAQQNAEQPVSQGLGVAFGPAGLELRLYLHGRTATTQADHYTAWRWQPGGPARSSRYAFYFLPETPAGQRPLDLVPEILKPAFARLLADRRLGQLSGFWLRENAAGQLEQVDVALPWLPAAAEVPGLAELAAAFQLPPAEHQKWQGLPVRHVACALGSTQPSATLYASGPAGATWPASEAEWQAQVRRAAQAQQQVTTPLLEKLSANQPTTPSTLPDAPPALGSFYDGSAALWETVLGPELHYHMGIFDPHDTDPDDANMLAAMRRAVTELYPFIPAGGRLYDLGCGWGGPLAMWSRDLHCRSLGLTSSQNQYRYVAAQGLPVRWADAEQTLPPGHFDCAVLLESLSHIHDKARLLRQLRPLAGRLVMRINCQDQSPASTAFGNTMHLVSTGELRRLLEAAGWRIRHWQDRRPETLPTFQVWHRRLQTLPPTPDKHLEIFRTWCTRVVQISAAWGACNPLVEVMAD